MTAKTLTAVVRTFLFMNAIYLMSSVPAGSFGNIKLFQSPLAYSVDTTILLNDVFSGAKEVGYKIKSKLIIDPVWSDSDTHFLLKFELQSPKLHVRSKTAPHEGFIEHASLLDGYKNSPFLADWKDGIIEHVYINTEEEPAWINYKKGLLSVFQFQILDQDSQETDISGKCDTSYHSLSPTVIRKVKANCVHSGVSTKKTKTTLSAVSKSIRISKYEFTEDMTALKHIYAEELHEMLLGMKQNAGNKVRVWQELSLLDDNVVNDALKAKFLTEALPECEAKYGFVLKEQDLQLNINSEEKSESYNLANMIKDNRELLQAENLGTGRSALVFINAVKAMRIAKSEEILKVLKGVKNKEILSQLFDIVGYSQTFAAHQAAKAFLDFESEYDKDDVERYLWALAIGPTPHTKVILDVLKMSENTKLPVQISETLLLTVSAMTSKLIASTGNNSSDFICNKVKDHITINLSKCKETRCIMTYLRALQNMKRADTVPILMDYAQKGERSVVVMALKALRAMPKEYWSKEVKKLCKKVAYQLDRPYDSSARTLAVDILLGSAVRYEVEEMLHFLASDDKDFEVKQFALQGLQMFGEKSGKIKKEYDHYLRKYRYINNYDVLAPKGMSTALSRTVSENQWSNISLVSVQEISGGVLKRGHVDLLIDDAGETKQLFSLGLFAGGLSSMMGGSTASDEDESVEDEPTTAGMELNVLGVHIRPFTFFSGQGELMGHVWSGTASEKTTAFQSLVLVQDESRQVVLGSGALARWSLTAAASVDLAGQIQMSLWSRTAHSIVDKASGIAVQSTYNADTPFVKSEVRFVLTMEPKLDLETDIDFYDGVKLCIQVKQPEIIVRHNITKVESIPEYVHSMRKSKFRSIVIPGRTYALNRKNNLMCNDIHNKK